MDTFLLLCWFWATVFNKPRLHLPNVWQETQGTASLHNRTVQQWQAQTLGKAQLSAYYVNSVVNLTSLWLPYLPGKRGSLEDLPCNMVVCFYL